MDTAVSRHLEAFANAIVGIAIAQILLWLYGIAFSQALSLNIAMFAASYARSFLIRIIFARISQ